MSLDPKLLEILACPRCKGALDWVAEPGELVCRPCAKAYPVKDGIPDLLPESGRDVDA